jgi:hypothetical protein
MIDDAVRNTEVARFSFPPRTTDAAMATTPQSQY